MASPSAHAALSVALVISLGGLSGAGCAKARAAAPREIPPLDVPPVPARVISPTEAVAAEALPAGGEAAAPGVEETAPPPVEPTEPTRSLRTDASPAAGRLADEAERPARTLQPAVSQSEGAIRDRLAQAAGWLQQVDYRQLNQNLREQYAIAERFVQQARDALAAGNLVYADTLAGKAAEIAEVLPRR
jgi:hypothetical protein